jgi:hypothetical protein
MKEESGYDFSQEILSMQPWLLCTHNAFPASRKREREKERKREREILRKYAPWKGDGVQVGMFMVG